MFIDCGDIKVHYRVYGRGDPLIMLHGNGEDWRYFKNQLPDFSKKYQMFLIDTRGHGTSQRGQRSLHYELFMRDLYNFMDALKLDSANMLGFSDGAITALLLALKRPDKVRKLVLNGVNINPSGIKSVYREKMTALSRSLAIPARFNKKLYQKKELLDLMLHEPDIKIEELKNVKSKTLVIVGENDMIRDEHTRLIAKNIPECVFKVMPMGDHFCAQKLPVAFNRAVLDFLAGRQADESMVRAVSS